MYNTKQLYQKRNSSNQNLSYYLKTTKRKENKPKQRKEKHKEQKLKTEKTKQNREKIMKRKARSLKRSNKGNILSKTDKEIASNDASIYKANYTS